MFNHGVSTMGVLKHLNEHPPRRGPEWGSGGIFGLKYHRGVLYYTLAFEAESFFIGEDGVRYKYTFEQVGEPPASGGDTYNAVDAVDDEVYFGGWVHAPAVYRGRSGVTSTIDFRNKFSHVHRYEIAENKVTLLWKEGMRDPEKWVGEVSEIVYNPYRDELLLARGDGYENLGVYGLDLGNKALVRYSDKPVLKGSIVADYACFATHYHPGGMKGVECVDLVEKRVFTIDSKPYYVDDEAVVNPYVGCTGSAYGKLFVFTRGGVWIAEPVDREIYFVRLFDLPNTQYGPLRTNVKHVGGGLVTAFNAYTHASVNVGKEEERAVKKQLGAINAPTILLYLKPPVVKVVSTFGPRITSIEVVEDKLLLGTNTMANTGRFDASPFDQGYRGFVALSIDKLYGEPEAATILLNGFNVRDRVFGGIPVHGYREPSLTVLTKKPNELEVREVVLTMPPQLVSIDKFSVPEGRSRFDLSRYNGILSFKFNKPLSDDELVIVDLK